MSTTLVAGSDRMLEFEAADVTGSHRLEVTDVEATLPAGAVAKALASRMALPENVSWSLRDDLSSELLQDSKPLGDQLGTRKDIRLTVTPKAHLG
jgi:hypothetical protein